MNETAGHASDSPDSSDCSDCSDSPDSPAITQTRLTHATHRLATDLLVDAVDRPSADPGRLAELRDFVVTHLRHHHETEDALLWPRVVAVAPETEHLLHRLSQEHDRLDDALDRLAAVDIPTGDQAAGTDTGPAGHGAGQGRAGLRDDLRPVLREAAVAVRDSVRDHLAHEEPVLFPVLRDRITAAEWEEFAHQVVVTTPPVAGHLMIGFLDEAGTPAEVRSMLTDMPGPVRDLVPAMRSRAAEDLRILRGAAS
ncbi:hemerythrin domain-containing protein [Streptomyces sp. NPDC055058]